MHRSRSRLARLLDFGESEEEAIRELEPAIKAWIEAARAAGNPRSLSPAARLAEPRI